MERVAFICGALLIVFGCALIFGSYYLFNHYSLRGPKDFAVAEEWRFPSNPLELSQGDKVTISTSIDGAGVADLYVVNTGGRQILIQENTVNLTGSGTSFTYYVSSNDFYYYLVDVKSISTHNGLSVTLAIEVFRITQNRLFLLTGAITLLAGVMTIAFAVGTRTKHQEQLNFSIDIQSNQLKLLHLNSVWVWVWDIEFLCNTTPRRMSCQ
jgi:hypothetical protein